MENGELSAIRIANIRKITDALCAKSSPMSRAELSQRTGLSLMTVGKTADQLEQYGIITQKKREDGSPGRKSQVASMDGQKRFSIYDYSSFERKLFVTDQTGRICAEYLIPDGGFDSISAQAFMECAMNDCELVGCGLILPDSEPGCAAKEFFDANGSKPDAAYKLCEVSALGFYAGEHSMLHVKIAEEISGAIILNGKLYKGSMGRACDLNELTVLCGDLAKAIRAICLVLDPETVRVESENVVKLEALSDELANTLAEFDKSLDFVVSDRSLAVSAIASALLEKRIANIFD